MAGEIVTTVVGNLTADPELKFTQGGQAVANFTVASTPRIMRDGQWTDGESVFMRCNVWRQLAEHVTESLRKGSRVIVSGRLRQRSYEVDGQRRTVMELEVEEIGASLRYATVTVNKAQRSGEQQAAPQHAADPWGEQYPPEGRGHQQPQQQYQQRPPSPGWGSQQGRPAHAQQSGGYVDEPPF